MKVENPRGEAFSDGDHRAGARVRHWEGGCDAASLFNRECQQGDI